MFRRHTRSPYIGGLRCGPGELQIMLVACPRNHFNLQREVAGFGQRSAGRVSYRTGRPPMLTGEMTGNTSKSRSASRLRTANLEPLSFRHACHAESWAARSGAVADGSHGSGSWEYTRRSRQANSRVASWALSNAARRARVFRAVARMVQRAVRKKRKAAA
jgi:hypothetical protein